MSSLGRLHTQKSQQLTGVPGTPEKGGWELAFLRIPGKKTVLQAIPSSQPFQLQSRNKHKERISKHLEIAGTLCPHTAPWGFIKNKSCLTNLIAFLIELQDWWMKEMQAG